MIYVGQLIKVPSPQQEILVCHVSLDYRFAAVADAKHVSSKDNFSKPKPWKVTDLVALIRKKGVESEQFDYPGEMSFSDKELIKQRRETWLINRDWKHWLTAPLTTPELINQYIYGDGVADELEELIKSNLANADLLKAKLLKVNSDKKKEVWTTKGAYYNALNRYIVFGCHPNALLPCKLKNSGSNYKVPLKIEDTNIKRGRKPVRQARISASNIGITAEHKSNIAKLVKFLKSEKGKKEYPNFTFKKAIELYQFNFETTILEREIEGEIHQIRIPFEREEDCLSEEQVYYHLKRIIDKQLYLQIKHGNISYEKDFADRQGSALEGVIGSTYRYEIDATVLDVYVRYPFDTTGQYSMGRPVLYLVIDVYSTMIVGFYLGFDGPNWEGAAQALVNACSCKVEFAARFNYSITEGDWPAHHVPVQAAVDNGTEQPDKVISTVLQAELGIRGYSFAAVYRGDAKGTVEGAFRCLENKGVHFVPGALNQHAQRGDQHASQQALLDYDSINIQLIDLIIKNNKSADRLHRFDINAIQSGIDITPEALYLHGLKQEMNGGRDGREIDPGRIHWAFLPEEEATVRGDGIYFKGLVYLSDYAKEADWFKVANLNGSFKIIVKRPKSWTSSLWHKTADGQYIRFDLKNVNNGSPFIGQHWEPVQHLLEQFKDKRHQNKLNTKKLTIQRNNLLAELKRLNEDAIEGADTNTSKSVQRDIKQRQKVFVAVQHVIKAIDHQLALQGDLLSQAPTQIQPQLDSDNDALL
ncbi:hypothetical protein [Colwellia psychrerythraea]|uniref:Integrase catalytic region n=2 Tax=Alteromonadales TaxID=135622 RepID=A0A099KAE2_COLPS|nr:hypothetical protein [Colwellia psychrerythraea]KGJ87326.1 hypothetical protein ND2E_0733 [Colwellia psychrerythraea]